MHSNTKKLLLSVIPLLSFILAACGGRGEKSPSPPIIKEPPPICNQGAQKPCTCASSATPGYQTCIGGTGWGPCVCPETKVCKPGSRTCKGDSLVSCYADGSGWATIEECSYGCVNAACRSNPPPPPIPDKISQCQPQQEVCNGKDDDCDGQVDESLTRSCHNACGTGNEICLSGTWRNCSAPTPKPESCNGKDDNCDGQIDEGCSSPAPRKFTLRAGTVRMIRRTSGATPLRCGSLTPGRWERVTWCDIGGSAGDFIEACELSSDVQISTLPTGLTCIGHSLSHPRVRCAGGWASYPDKSCPGKDWSFIPLGDRRGTSSQETFGCVLTREIQGLSRVPLGVSSTLSHTYKSCGGVRQCGADRTLVCGADLGASAGNGRCWCVYN